MTRRLPIIVLILAVLGAACGSSEDTTTTAATATSTTTMATTATTEPAVTTTTAAATTTTAAATTSTAAAPVYTVGEPTLGPPAPLPDSGGAAGSGCAPGSDDLPDGIWYGIIEERTDTSITFDLACFYFGDIAYVEGERDGVEVNNDYYIRNDNDTLRTITVDQAATTVYEIGFDQQFLALPFSDWPDDPSGYTPCPGAFCGVWLYVNGGQVTEILEQYVP